MQLVTRKAMIRAGTARRSAGSAVKRRRYAGLAIDCANPLIESELTDALAASARAIARPPSATSSQPWFGMMCRISPNHFHWNRKMAFCRESFARKCQDAVKGKKVLPRVQRELLGTQRTLNDVAHVARQAGLCGGPPQRPFRAAAAAGFEHAPASECGQEPRRDLRVLGIENQYRVDQELVARAVGPIELGLVRHRERSDQRPNPVGVGHRESRMRGQR